MGLLNKIKASMAICQGENHLDRRDFKSALENFRLGEALFGKATSKTDFFNLYLKIAECSYLMGENESGDAAILTAEKRLSNLFA